jgi:hypothetical protein
LWCGGFFRRRAAFLNGEDFGADRHGGPFFNLQFFDYTRYGRGYLGVDFVGYHLGYRLVLLYGVARLLEPLADCARCHALTQLRHCYRRYCHQFLLF